MLVHNKMNCQKQWISSLALVKVFCLSTFQCWTWYNKKIKSAY